MNNTNYIKYLFDYIKNMTFGNPGVIRETYGRGEHPNSKANLTPFKEGVSGNPSGRPFKYVNLAKALSRIGKMPPYDFDFAPPDHRTAVLHKIWQRASEGSIQHIKILCRAN